jgi:hypothetical protein
MATRKNLKKTGKKRIKPKGGAKKRKTVRGGVWPWPWTKPKLKVEETTYSPFHDQTKDKDCDIEAMPFFKRAIYDLFLVYSKEDIVKKGILKDKWFSDLDNNQNVIPRLKFCRDRQNRSLLYIAIEYQEFIFIRDLIKKGYCKPQMDNINMELELILDKSYIWHNNKDIYYEIMDLVIEDTPNVDLEYIIESATNDTPNILIILTMFKRKGKLNINSVSEENQCKLLLILFNISGKYVYDFGLQKYLELLEFIINKINIDLNQQIKVLFNTILHTLVKEILTTFTDFSLSTYILDRKKNVFSEKINFLIKHGADFYFIDKDKKQVLDYIAESKISEKEKIKLVEQMTLLVNKNLKHEFMRSYVVKQQVSDARERNERNKLVNKTDVSNPNFGLTSTEIKQVLETDSE